MKNHNLKEAQIEKIKREFLKSEGICITNFVGLKSNDVTRIRREIKAVGGNSCVIKNTLLKRAFLSSEFQSMFANLKGANAIVFAYENFPSVAKIVFNNLKEHECLVIKGGILDGKLLSGKDVEQIAKLPSRLELLSMVLATLQEPITSFARVIDKLKNRDSL